jgi:hypothetical protein
MRKIIDFLIVLGNGKSKKKHPQTTPKCNPKWSRIEPGRKVKRKIGKV